MNTLMLVITVVSMVVAATASAIAWRATRAERQRSAARIAALAAAAGVTTAKTRQAPGGHAAVEPPGGLHEFMPAREADSPHGSVAAPGTSGDEAMPSGAMFGARTADSGSGNRQRGLLAAAAVAAALVTAGSLVMFVGGRLPAAAGTATQAPLELVALGHERTDGQLVVSGLVKNPVSGQVVNALEAHVRAFDAAGILIATQFAPVNAAALAPGQDAPFAVTLGEATTAARYRVSFASRGTMLAHMDRRTNLPAAVTADAR